LNRFGSSLKIELFLIKLCKQLVDFDEVVKQKLNFMEFFRLFFRLFSVQSSQLILSFLNDFGALSPNRFLDFFSARKVPEIILNEYSKNTENAFIEWLRNETTRYFTKTKVYVVSVACSKMFWYLKMT
jgi:hypothetical protein